MSFASASDPDIDLPIEAAHALPPGARLEYFQIDRVLFASSFSVIYQATDLALEQKVAIKEYMPVAIAARGEAGQVVLRGAAHAESFLRGQLAFMDEARTLARCDHPSLLRVSRLWEANDTVYRAMPFYSGTSLLAWRHGLQEPPFEAPLHTLLEGLLGAIETLANAGMAHRRIAPFNILLRPNGVPVLLDFDAVRHAMISDKSQSLMAALDPSFAPVEQFADSAEVSNGLGADLYAVAAVMHFCISGHWPTSARIDSGRREPLADVLRRLRESTPLLRYSPEFVAAIDAVLVPRHGDRPQTVAQFRAMFGLRPVEARPDADASSPPAADGIAVTTEADVAAADEPQSLHGWKIPASKLAPSSAAAPIQPSSLTSSASVLELLAGFDRRPRPDTDPAEPFQTPPLPVLTEEAPVVAAPVSPPKPPPEPTPARPASAAFMSPPTVSAAEASERWVLPDSQPPSSRFDTRSEDAPWPGLGTYRPVARRLDETAEEKSWLRRLTIWGLALLVLGGIGAIGWKINDQRVADSVLTELAASLKPDTVTPAASASASMRPTLSAESQALLADKSPVPSELPSSAATPSAGLAPAPAAQSASQPANQIARSDVEKRDLPKSAPTPRDECGTRTEFDLYRCLRSQCAQAQWAQHPQCKALRSNGSTAN